MPVPFSIRCAGFGAGRNHVVHRKLIATLAGVAVLGLGGGAVAASGAGSAKTTIKAVNPAGVTFKANRYVQDGLRWDKDAYSVKSGGTLHIVNIAADEGPHTFTVVKKTQVPKSFNCPVCDKLGQAHGADPNSDAPPKFPYLENGKGQKTPPNVDLPGDSGITGSGKKNESIDLKVTAKAGTTLNFICLIHPWMQAKVTVTG